MIPIFVSCDLTCWMPLGMLYWMIIVPYWSYPGSDDLLLEMVILPPIGCVPVRTPYTFPHVGQMHLWLKARSRQSMQKECLHSRVFFFVTFIFSKQMGQVSSLCSMLFGGDVLIAFLSGHLRRECCRSWWRYCLNLAICAKVPVTVSCGPSLLLSNKSCGNPLCSSWLSFKLRWRCMTIKLEAVFW